MYKYSETNLDKDKGANVGEADRGGYKQHKRQQHPRPYLINKQKLKKKKKIFFYFFTQLAFDYLI